MFYLQVHVGASFHSCISAHSLSYFECEPVFVWSCTSFDVLWGLLLHVEMPKLGKAEHNFFNTA